MGKRGPTPANKLTVLDRPLAKRLAPPQGLTPRARALWNTIVSSLPPEHFKSTDVPLLTAYVEAADLAKKAEGQIRKLGLIVAGGNGGPKANPAVAIKTAQAGIMASLATKLGLCRSARRGADKDAQETQPKPKRAGLMFQG